jgi:hypothetical protein
MLMFLKFAQILGYMVSLALMVWLLVRTYQEHKALDEEEEEYGDGEFPTNTDTRRT